MCLWQATLRVSARRPASSDKASDSLPLSRPAFALLNEENAAPARAARRIEIMAYNLDLSMGQIALEIDGADGGRFEVLRFRGSEGLCRLHRFEIELASADIG